MKKTLIYFDGGDDCLFSKVRNKAQLAEIRQDAINKGHTCFLSGYRYYDNESETVIVYFKEKPSSCEIERRRKNGFRAAKLTIL